MKFENIKIDDTVFVQKTIRYGWNSGVGFWVPEKVIRVSKTQFATESGKRFRKDGNGIGDEKFERAYFLGDQEIGWGRNIIKDQTEEMKAFQDKLNLEYQISLKITKLSIGSNTDFNIIQLKSIDSILDKLIIQLKK